MQRDSILIIFIISVIAVVLVSPHNNPVESRKKEHVCDSIDVRNKVTNLVVLENCTIIAGYLFISHIYEDDSFSNYSFPNLREIQDFLAIYEVPHMKSVGKLFPNLRIVRGYGVIHNYAIILYQLQDLEEIGLTNLMHVGRGQVMIGRCPNVCYVETIDWKQIGVIDHLTNEVVAKCPTTCPLHCSHCWNEFHCQRKSDGCHEECYGCTKPNSAAHCLSCKNYEENMVCVKQCSPDKYAHHNTSLCLSREECLSFLNNTQFIYKNQCIEGCPVDTEYGKDRECHYCGENCTVLCEPPEKIVSLEDLDELSRCTIIDGDLKIEIIDEFLFQYLHHGFSRIKEIYGDLVIKRSVLRSLEAFSNLQLIHGNRSNTNPKALFVYENPHLRQLWNFKFKILKGYIQFYNNPSLCYPELQRIIEHTHTTDEKLLKLMERFNGYGMICNDRKQLTLTKQLINSTNITLEWAPIKMPTNDAVFYSIFYTKSYGFNVTYFENEDQCNQKWNNTFVQTTNIFIKYLEPYTDYAYFFKIHAGVTVMRTIMYYFKTAPDDPSSLENLSAYPLSDTSINITWLPPANLNGNFSYYAITMLLEEDYLPTLEAIDYCLKKPFKDEPPITIEPKEITEKVPKRIYDDECRCEGNDTTELYENTKNTITDFDFHEVCRKDCSKYMYSNAISFPDSHILVPRDAPADFKQKDFKNTSYQINNLRPFSTYIFFLRACNENLNGSRELCSGVEMTSTRTKPRATADRVENVKVTQIDEESVRIDWSKPSETNSELLAYVIELDRTDLKHFTMVEECISKKRRLSLPRSYILQNLSPGIYAVRVKAVSLAGPGEPSEWTSFDLQTSLSENSVIGILVALFFVTLITVGTGIAYYRYKKRHALDGIRLIASINPDYAGPIYVEDEWEINHNDVEIKHEIGKGSFGLVYEGFIKSRGLKCAIKTVSENATITSRMEFLNEGSVMKSFNSAHHVVKLLGIVSRGPIPMVIMELMDRGDLKSYLRLCREPSRNLTTNEMYRMSAEIADGMAYLAAKKFVHRDLATRNCMVDANYTVKIGDFGMARDIYETDYYRKDTVGFLPVRWMAPESLADGVFTSDSDVWSYGVVLWEMATLAELPYQGLSNEEVFLFVKQRGKLSRPPKCSEILFEVMDACWQWRPYDRPTFRTIVDKLSNHVGQEFHVMAFCFSQEGIDSARTAGARTYNPPAMSAMLRRDEQMYGQFDTSDDEEGMQLYDGGDDEYEESRPTFPSS